MICNRQVVYTVWQFRWCSGSISQSVIDSFIKLNRRDIFLQLFCYCFSFVILLSLFLISPSSCYVAFTWNFFSDSIQHVIYLTSSAHEWSVCLRSSRCLPVCMYAFMCVSVRRRLERHLRALHLCEHSPRVKIKDVSCFPRYPWWVWLHHEAITLESFAERGH